MKMKIHFGLILFYIFSSLFASSEAEGGNRQIEETEEKRGISVEVETLNVQLEILSLLKQIKEQIKEQNNEVIKEISNGLKENTKRTEENTKVIKEISSGLKELRENTNEISNGQKQMKETSKQVSKNTEFIKDFTSEIKDNTNGIKQNTDETKKITIYIKDIIYKIGENTEKEKEIDSYFANNKKEIPARNCDDLRLKGDKQSGIRAVYPFPGSQGIKVLCDQQTEDGGWTVFQARENLPERENFQRSWKDYSHGFGNHNGEFWMGFELINVMSKLDVMELRVDLEDDTGEKRFAKYESFSVEDEDEKFKLNIGSYSGTAGNSLSYNNQRPFTTMDQDNDPLSNYNCADLLKGAWWYGKCGDTNLNGMPYVGTYSSSNYDGIEWGQFSGKWNSLAKTKMMFRLSRKFNN